MKRGKKDFTRVKYTSKEANTKKQKNEKTEPGSLSLNEWRLTRTVFPSPEPSQQQDPAAVFLPCPSSSASP